MAKSRKVIDASTSLKLEAIQLKYKEDFSFFSIKKHDTARAAELIKATYRMINTEITSSLEADFRGLATSFIIIEACLHEDSICCTGL